MRRATVSILLVVLLPLTGCGPSEVVVSGTVTLDGKPLEDGHIAFRPLPATATAEAAGATIKGGKYQVKVRPGQNRVEITAARAAAPGPKEAIGPLPAPKSIIPERYNVQSKLTEEVRAGGPNEFNFALTSH